MTTLIVEHHTVSRAGLNWHVATAGPQEAPPLLLLHCWSGNWQLWQTTITQLAGQYRCIMPDHLGFGGSDKPPGAHYDIADQAERTGYILDHFGVARTRVIGHSMGGHIALTLAAMAPDRIDKLVVVDPAVTGRLHPLGFIGIATLWPVRQWGITWLSKVFVRAGLAVPLIGAQLMRSYFPHPLEQLEAAKYWAGQLIADGQTRSNAWAQHAIRQWDVTPHLKQITAPTLAIWGGLDWCVPLSELDVLTTYIPNIETHIIPNVGHFPMIEAFGEYLDSVRVFLDN